MERYASIPELVLVDSRLPSGAIVLYGRIALEIQETDDCLLTNSEFADIFSSSISTISSWVSVLEQYNYISTEVVKVECRRKVTKRRITLFSDKTIKTTKSEKSIKTTQSDETIKTKPFVKSIQTKNTNPTKKLVPYQKTGTLPENWYPTKKLVYQKTGTLPENWYPTRKLVPYQKTGTPHDKTLKTSTKQMPKSETVDTTNVEPRRLFWMFLQMNAKSGGSPSKMSQSGSGSSATSVQNFALFFNKLLNYKLLKDLIINNINNNNKKNTRTHTCIRVHKRYTFRKSLVVNSQQTSFSEKSQQTSFRENHKRITTQESGSAPVTTDAIDLGIIKKSKTKAQKNKQKKSAKELWQETAMGYLDEFKFDSELDEALADFIIMQSEFDQRKPLLFIKKQLATIHESSLSLDKKIEAVKTTVLRGWKSLDYVLNDLQSGKSNKYGKAHLGNDYMKSATVDISGLTPEQARYHAEMCKLEELAKQNPGEVFYSADGNWCAGAGVGVTVTQEGAKRMREKAEQEGLLF